MIQFQFTPLREGRPRPGNSLAHRLIFQFTPLREGRQQNQTKYALFFLQL